MYQKERELYLASKNNAEAQAKQWAKANYADDIEVFIVYGLGIGMHISELAQLKQGHQSIKVIECNYKIFRWALNHGILAQLEAMGVEYEFIVAISDFSKQLEGRQEKKIKVICYSPSLQVIPPNLRLLRERLENHYMRTTVKSMYEGDLYKHYQEHEKRRYPNISQWYSTVSEKPIVVVSAGPSLSKSLPILRKLQEQVFIFATGRVLKALIANGVRVDMFCIIDPHEKMKEQFGGMEDLAIPFVFLNTVSPSVVEKYQGPKYIAYSEDFPEQQEGRIETGGSVATAVLDLSIKFGAKKIIFVGQDLCYDQGLSHAIECTPNKVSNMNHLRKIEGVDGRYHPTLESWLRFKIWIEQRIHKTREVVFINTAEAGALIRGCINMNLEAAINYGQRIGEE